MFYKPNYYLTEPRQSALIYYHDGIEDLVIKPSYQGNSADFVWVVPTPNEPKVAKSDESLFRQLQKLTTVDSNTYPVGTLKDLSTSSVSRPESVTVIEEKTIDAYNTVVLKATSETALSRWMDENGYSFPKDSNYLLADYVNQGWYFVLVKIRQEAQSAVADDLSNGTITPLRFTFSSEKIIYPMKLTKIALEQKYYGDIEYKTSYSATELALYVLTNYRVNNSQLDTSFASWLKPKEIKQLLSESSEDDWISNNKKLFLTKLTKWSYLSTAMNNDLILAQSEKNGRYPEPFYTTKAYWLSFGISFLLTLLASLISPIVLLFVIVSLKQELSTKWQKPGRWLKAGLTVTQLLFIILVTYSSRFSLGYRSDKPFWENGSSFGIVIASSILFLILTFKLIRDCKGSNHAQTNPIIEPGIIN